jgi:hypothetical protein
MLIITGPGRSGTSVLALFCKRMGYDPGGEWCDLVDAGLENGRIVKINDALLRELRQHGTTQQAMQTFAEEMKAIRVDVVKDPRFTYHPEVLRAWRSVRDDLRVLVTYRTPEHCVASRRRKANFLMDRRSKSPDAIRCQLADSIETLLTLEIPYQLLLFPRFLGQFEQVYLSLRELGLDIDRHEAERAWGEVVDRKKVHIGEGAEAGGAQTEDAGNRSQPTVGMPQWRRRLAIVREGLSDLPIATAVLACGLLDYATLTGSKMAAGQRYATRKESGGSAEQTAGRALH